MRQTSRTSLLRLLRAGACVAAALALALGSASSLPTRACAQDDEYRHAVEQALAEFESGNFAESLALFRRAHAMRPSARTLRGLGKASFELRRYVDAVTYFTDALSSTANPLTDEQRTEVSGLLSRAEAFVGRYHVTTEPEGAAITVDGNAASADLVLDIGEHTIAAAAEGHQTATRRITVAGGEDERLAFTLETTAVVVEERIVERVRSDPGEPLRIAGWVMGGVGVVALGVGFAAVGVREERIGNYNTSVLDGGCPGLLEDGTVPPGAEPGCYEFQNTWRTMDTLAYAFGISGGVLLAAGVTFVVIGSVMPAGDTTSSSEPSARERDVARGIAFVRSASGPALSMGCGSFADLGVACSGRF